MRGRAPLIGWSALLASAIAAGCGGRPIPRDEDVYHEAALRPGEVPPVTEGERELLARLPELAADQSVHIGDREYVPLASYASASGRRCTPIREAGTVIRTRIACESDAGWVFVPEVFGGDDPFIRAASESGAETAGAP
jgi:hypothetical protein